MNIVIITGASSGIGLEFAVKMDSAFHNVDEFWLVARREDKLQEAAKLLNHKTRLFPMDITDSTRLDLLEDTVIEKNAAVRMLINCAGYGLLGAFSDQDTDGALGMIRLNCMALTELTHRMIPYMRRNSRIIQLASCAAFLPQPDFAVYAASKAYVLSFSRALRRELKPFGIWVTSVCPGPVDTPFFAIAEQGGSTLAVKKLVMVSAKKVVEQALRDSYYRRELSVCSLPIKAMELLSKTVPHKLILDIMNLMKKG
ncbi:MAG: SDR family NAD(P)-dependent oxidoreductase [Butyrivibrio sp.]|nr:SDR family NAD(P)-dependent oxidoreductase [Butyrivibrio sp.]